MRAHPHTRCVLERLGVRNLDPVFDQAALLDIDRAICFFGIRGRDPTLKQSLAAQIPWNMVPTVVEDSRVPFTDRVMASCACMARSMAHHGFRKLHNHQPMIPIGGGVEFETLASPLTFV